MALHDEAVARALSRDPDMSMTPEEEEVQRAVALDHVPQQAADNGLSPAAATRHTDIHGRRFDAFRQALRSDPPKKVGPMKVSIRQSARPVKANACVYSPTEQRGCLGTWRLRWQWGWSFELCKRFGRSRLWWCPSRVEWKSIVWSAIIEWLVFNRRKRIFNMRRFPM